LVENQLYSYLCLLTFLKKYETFLLLYNDLQQLRHRL
jgi:hypothetical protein